MANKFSTYQMMLIVSYAGLSISRLLELRRINEAFREAIDDYSERTWFHLLKTRSIILAFRMSRLYMSRLYMIQIVIKTVSWYKASDNKSSTSYMPDRETYEGDRLTKEFIISGREDIDDLFIANGYINQKADVKLIVSNTTLTSATQHTALSGACSERNFKRIRYLLDHGANPDVRLTDNMTAFSYLIKYATDEEVKSFSLLAIVNLFVEKNVNVVRCFYAPGITIAIMNILINKGHADLNNRQEDIPILHYLVETCSNVNVVKHLIAMGADKEILDKNGDNALVYCCLNEDLRYDNLVYLMEIGLDFGTSQQRRRVLNKLITMKPSDTDRPKHLALMRHVLSDRFDTLAVSMPNASTLSINTPGASTSAVNMPGASTSAVNVPNASTSVEDDVYELLDVRESSRLDIGYFDSEGETVFMKDIDFDIMELLVGHLNVEEKTFLLNVVNDKNETALSKAYERKKLRTIELLIDNGADHSTLFNTVGRDNNDGGRFKLKKEIIAYINKKAIVKVEFTPEEKDIQHTIHLYFLYIFLFFAIFFVVAFLIAKCANDPSCAQAGQTNNGTGSSNS